MFDWLPSMNKDDNEQIMHGVYCGVVTDNKDPSNLGRLKVKIPIIDDEMEFDWARMATPMGGASRGALFIPEVGDEVLIAFELGDIRSPIIIGSLWNETDKPPEGKNDKNDIRKIKTRAGHEIIFNDSDNDGKITIKTKAGHQLDFEDKSKAITLKTSDGSQKLVMDGTKGNIAITSGQTEVKITKTGDITLQGNNAITIKGTQIKLESNAMLQLKANANVSIQATGILELKGSMVKIN